MDEALDPAGLDELQFVPSGIINVWQPTSLILVCLQ
jgi:hypothetical protein